MAVLGEGITLQDLVIYELALRDLEWLQAILFRLRRGLMGFLL